MLPELYTPERMAERLNCTVGDLGVHWRRGEVDRVRVTPRIVRYLLVERPASESNAPIGFRRPKSASGGRGDRREYMRAYQREWVAKRRAEFFAGRCCVDCGATEQLELDHRDPEQKVSHRIWSWAQERREAEIAKCDVRCQLCHRRRHGPAHGSKRRYEAGCRCVVCVTNQRARRKVRRSVVPSLPGEDAR